LGNEVARLLAMAGVGRLVLCDPDLVAESNLSRTVLFRSRDVGRPKALVAAEALADLAPGTAVEARVAPLLSGVGLGELRVSSLVVSCLDSRAARVGLAARCNLVGSALLDGGTHPWGGELVLYRPGGPCYGCGLTEEQLALQDDPWSCSAPPARPVHGASAPVSALVGAQLAVWGVRILLDLPVPAGPVRLDSAGAAPMALAAGRRGPAPDCPLHERLPPGLVQRVPVSCLDPIDALLALLDPEEEPLGWAAFGRPGARLPMATATRLRAAPSGTALHRLGVAPCEVLAVLGPGAAAVVRYLELSPATGVGGEVQ
jgi:molybdopterin/thiamine biosynthesis adenylyltransferase